MGKFGKLCPARLSHQGGEKLVDGCCLGKLISQHLPSAIFPSGSEMQMLAMENQAGIWRNGKSQVDRGRAPQCPIPDVKIGTFMFQYGLMIQLMYDFKVRCQPTKQTLLSTIFWVNFMTVELHTHFKDRKVQRSVVKIFWGEYSLEKSVLRVPKYVCTFPLIKPGSPLLRSLGEPDMCLLKFGSTMNWNLNPSRGNLDCWKDDPVNCFGAEVIVSFCCDGK